MQANSENSTDTTQVAAKIAIAIGILTAALISWQSRSAYSENVWLFLLAACVMFVASLVAWRSLQHIRGIVLLTVLMHGIALFGTPLFEDDYHRYLWDGYVTNEIASPYGVAPEQFFDDPRVAADMQATLSGVNHPEIPTIYGPAAQSVFAIAAAIDRGNEQLLRGIFAFLHIVLLTLLVRRVPHRNWWLYVLNPLVYKEVALTGHFDFLIGFGLALMLTAAHRQRWFAAGSWLALAVCSKLVAVVALVVVAAVLWPMTHARLSRPLRHFQWREGLVFGGALIAVCVLFYAPFLRAGATDLLGFSSFATQWQFNAGVYQLLLSIFAPTTLRWFLAICGIALSILVYLKTSDVNTKPTHSAACDPVYSHALGITALLAFILIMGPVLNPWYCLWLMPLVLLEKSNRNHQSVTRSAMPAWIIAACSMSLLSYLHGLFWQSDRYLPYQLPVLISVLEHIAIWMCIGASLACLHRDRRALQASHRA
jgi:alpha-1,6-mannosyltransferase